LNVMERIYEISTRLTEELDAPLHRYLYDKIAWSDRLIMIKGARGVGKTTIMKQRCKENGDKGVYASLDQLFFNDHTIVELADYHYKHGGTHLYLDEVHLYPRPNWEQELKNIYDSYPSLHIVFTGSSLLHLNSKIADLSRRVAVYDLRGLSFREYLNFTGNYNLESISLNDILNNHRSLAAKISSNIRVFGEFEKYLKKGYYPFFMDSSEITYAQRVERLVLSVIDIDIPAISSIEYETQLKLKKLLVVLAEQVPFVPNMTNLSRDIEVTRNQLMKFFTLLSEGAILRTLMDGTTQPKRAAKPEKILFDNPSVMQALGITNKVGTARESFVASMLSHEGQLFAPKDGDFLLNRTYLFEVGGKGKGFSQIADQPNSYVIADNIEIGAGNKIPIWLLGFLY
ncbi:MAG: AAA family ATPase, partial [Muribaculaceae bacterium]|nr:AAA family ATPase [Muribaculaceae bacterium]